ncbi:unnamed protein product [Spodoptera exigua]|nr:unnamed protein product [Spodoptera exigua]
MSLPDACAELVLAEMDKDREDEGDGERDRQRQAEPDEQGALECCRTLGGSGALRCASPAPALHVALGQLSTLLSLATLDHCLLCLATHCNVSDLVSPDSCRPALCRRDAPARPADAPQHRQSLSSCSSRTSGCGGGGAAGGAGGAGARLSAMVPDVAMAPNANTHLLTARDYFRHAPPWEYSGGAVLQLDLGDGATHTPRPGSRAARAGAAHSRPSREHAPGISCLRSRPDEDELRAAIELSVIRAYSSSRAPAGAAPLLLGGSHPQHPQHPQHPAHPGLLPPTHRERSSATLPHARGDRPGLAQLAPTHHNPGRSRASASPQRGADLPPGGAHHGALSRLSSVAAEASGSRSPSPGMGGPGPAAGGAGPAAGGPGPASPRPHDLLYRHYSYDIPHSPTYTQRVIQYMNGPQIALRAVREMSLPDACAELVLAEMDKDREDEGDGERDRQRQAEPDEQGALECCRLLSAGALQAGRARQARRRAAASLTTVPLLDTTLPLPWLCDNPFKSHTGSHTTDTTVLMFSQGCGGISCLRSRPDEDELRAAIELSVIRVDVSLTVSRLSSVAAEASGSRSPSPGMGGPGPAAGGAGPAAGGPGPASPRPHDLLYRHYSYDIPHSPTYTQRVIQYMNGPQIALRAVREMSLPDACAELVLAEMDKDREDEGDGERDRQRQAEPDEQGALECCRLLSAGALQAGRARQARRRAAASLTTVPLLDTTLPLPWLCDNPFKSHTGSHTTDTTVLMFSQGCGGISCLRSRPDEDELRAAIELSVIRVDVSLTVSRLSSVAAEASGSRSPSPGMGGPGPAAGGAGPAAGGPGPASPRPHDLLYRHYSYDIPHSPTYTQRVIQYMNAPQIALRAVREMSLPDACAELVLAEMDKDREDEGDGERDRQRQAEPDEQGALECCRLLSAGALQAGRARQARRRAAASLTTVPLLDTTLPLPWLCDNPFKSHTGSHTTDTTVLMFSQGCGGISCLRSRPDEDELRAAIELSVIRVDVSLTVSRLSSVAAEASGSRSPSPGMGGPGPAAGGAGPAAGGPGPASPRPHDLLYRHYSYDIPHSPTYTQRVIQYMNAPQIALRAVREMSLPDACAELVLAEMDKDREDEGDGERDRQRQAEPDEQGALECCRLLSAGALQAGRARQARRRAAASLTTVPLLDTTLPLPWLCDNPFKSHTGSHTTDTTVLMFSQGCGGISCLRSRPDEDELRAAIELSVIRGMWTGGRRDK